MDENGGEGSLNQRLWHNHKGFVVADNRYEFKGGGNRDEAGDVGRDYHIDHIGGNPCFYLKSNWKP